MSALFVGTSGWSYDDWKEIFYPKGLPSGDFLSFYAKHFSCVELNSSFYRLPKPEYVLSWAKKTSSSFYFCPKLSRLITHIKRFKGCEELLAQFIDAFDALKNRLGPFLIQIPESFAFERERVEPFFSFLRQHYSEYSFALEARHSTWIAKEPLELLTFYQIAWVIADSGGHLPSARVATAKNVYFRFHGPGKLYASKYQPKHLKPYVADAKEALKEGRVVWAFFNNDFYGYAIQNAKLFKELVIS